MIEDTAVVTDEVAESPEPTPETAPEVVVEDLLVEEVSIDGMCGVY